MSLVDLVLIALALLFALSGFRQGLLVSATSFLGFFGGAVLGAQLSGPVADRIDGSRHPGVRRAGRRPGGGAAGPGRWPARSAGRCGRG